MTDQTTFQAEASDINPANELIDFVTPESISTSANTRNDAGQVTKRFMDIFLSIAIAVVLSPVIIGCIFALSATSGGVIFRQNRVGKGGKTIRIYKFRTMVPDAQKVLHRLLAERNDLKIEYERDHKLKNDPRVTRVGKFLRRTSLDELPQLLTIIKGDMSLVGPRPVERFELLKYGVHARYYYAQKPGLTGLWQISGRSNIGFEQRVAMDAYYSRKGNLLLDVVIIIKTIKVVLFGSGAY